MSKEKLNVLLLGSGGREAAIAWKLSQSPRMGQFFIAPGNAGTAAFGTNLPIKPTDFEAVYDAVVSNDIDLVVAGNEDPLVEGLREFLESRAKAEGRELLMVGPGKAGAALEGSKDFAKHFMAKYGIPTAKYLTVTPDNIAEGDAFLESLEAPYVLKADGLAAGKGVLIIDSIDEARESLRRMLAGQFGKASAKVVIEQFLSGIECSVFVLTDGQHYKILPTTNESAKATPGSTPAAWALYAPRLLSTTNLWPKSTAASSSRPSPDSLPKASTTEASYSSASSTAAANRS